MTICRTPSTFDTATVRCERRTKRSKDPNTSLLSIFWFSSKSQHKKKTQRKETIQRNNATESCQRWDSDYQLQGCDMDHAPCSTWHRKTWPPKEKRMDRKHKTTDNRYVKMTKSVVILVYFSNSWSQCVKHEEWSQNAPISVAQVESLHNVRCNTAFPTGCPVSRSAVILHHLNPTSNAHSQGWRLNVSGYFVSSPVHSEVLQPCEKQTPGWLPNSQPTHSEVHSFSCVRLQNLLWTNFHGHKWKWKVLNYHTLPTLPLSLLAGTSWDLWTSRFTESLRQHILDVAIQSHLFWHKLHHLGILLFQKFSLHLCRLPFHPKHKRKTVIRCLHPRTLCQVEGIA